MGLHIGPLATAPDQDLPSEVIRVLGKLALEGATAHVHIRSGIDSLLGDTHLVVIGGKLHVVARKSSLDPLEDVPLLALPEIDEAGYRSVLQLRTTTGDKRVEIGATEENAVHALVAGLGPETLEIAAADVPTDVTAALDPLHREPTDLGSAREAFLELLTTRRQQRRDKLRADRIDHDRAAKRAKPRRPAKAATLRAEIGTATTDRDGDGIPDAPGDRASPVPRATRPEPPQQSSILGLAVLTMLVMLGLIGVASRLLGK